VNGHLPRDRRAHEPKSKDFLALRATVGKVTNEAEATSLYSFGHTCEVA